MRKFLLDENSKKDHTIEKTYYRTVWWFAYHPIMSPDVVQRFKDQVHTVTLLPLPGYDMKQ